MKFVDVADLPTEIAALIDEVESGEEITLWYGGKPVALLLPAHERPEPSESSP